MQAKKASPVEPTHRKPEGREDSQRKQEVPRKSGRT
jgi:hypothetical protein